MTLETLSEKEVQVITFVRFLCKTCFPQQNSS